MLMGCSIFKNKSTQVEEKIIEISLGCSPNEIGCVPKKYLEGEEIWVREFPKIVLGVQKASLHQDINTKEYFINLMIDPSGINQLAQYTKDHTGSIGVLLFDDRVIYASNITSSIDDGNIYFAYGVENNRKKSYEFCKKLDSLCSEKAVEVSRSPLVKSENLPYFDPDVIKDHFLELRESLFWYSNSESIDVYQDESLSGPSKLNINLRLENPNTGFSAYFVGFQDWLGEDGPFIYNHVALKIKNLGWVKRGELIPGNVIRSSYELTNELFTINILNKCPSEFKDYIKKNEASISAHKQDNFDLIFNHGKALKRDAEIGLCTQLGSNQCIEEIFKVEKKIKAMDCKDFILGLNPKVLGDKENYHYVENKCLKNQNVPACLLLAGYEETRDKEITLNQYLKKACQLKSGEACFKIGQYYTFKKDEKMAFLYFKQSCQFNYSSGCHQKAFMLFNKGKINDALNIYKRECDKHNYQSCSNLGGYFLTKRKFKSAIKVLQKSCDFNNPSGCYNLSCYYSLNEDMQSTLLALKKALIIGLPVDEWVRDKDPDLNFVRNTLEFKILMRDFSIPENTP